MTSISDEGTARQKEIIKLVQQAKLDARYFGKIYDHYFPHIYRYVFNRVGEKAAAEDITSRTFLSALQNLPTYREKGAFSAWIFTIARSRITDYYRQQSKAPNQTIDEIADDCPSPLRTAIRNEEVQRVTALVGQLPESKQELLRLRYSAELPFREIAAITGKSTASVKKTIYRVIEELRAQLEVDDA